MSFRLPSNLLSRNSRREAEFPISIEPFHLPAAQEMFFSNSLLGYQLKETVGLLDLWMQVDNLTKLWILCLHHRIPENI